jgi:hypothetical protein
MLFIYFFIFIWCSCVFVESVRYFELMFTKYRYQKIQIKDEFCSQFIYLSPFIHLSIELKCFLYIELDKTMLL